MVVCEGLESGPALALGERVRREIASSIEDAGARVTVSVGIASGSDETATYDSLFQIADLRLYQAKAAGRNCVIGDRVVSAENPVRLAYSSST